MSSPNIQSPTPRRLALSTVIKVLFGNLLFQISSAFVGFGLIFVIVFVGQSDVMDWFRFEGEWIATDGTLVEMNSTSFSVDEETVYRYTIAYTVDEATYTSNCYGFYWTSSNPTIAIEYAEKNPTRGRIDGMSMSLFSLSSYSP